MNGPYRIRPLPAVSLPALALATAITAVPAAADEESGLPEITPRAETAAVHGDEEGRNSDADDPAIWLHPDDPERSLVITALKEGGLHVYGLDAESVQEIPAPAPPGEGDAPGRFNNVDLVQGLETASGPVDIAVSSDRGHDRLRIHRIDPDDPDAPLTDVTDPDAPWIFSDSQEEVNGEATAYGLTTWTDPETGRSYAVATQAARTTLALLELLPTPEGTVTYREVRTIELPGTFRMPDGTSWTPCGDPGELPQAEGLAVDPESGTLFAAQETVGIWRMRADLKGEPELVDRVREYGVPAEYDEQADECIPGGDPGYGGEHLTADVEGLAVLPDGEGGGRLLASSQGDDSFSAYDLEEVREDDEAYTGGFRVVAASEELDGSEECDGLEVFAEPLGERYPDGLMVVQDGQATPENDDEERGDATGFKFVDLDDVRDALDD